MQALEVVTTIQHFETLSLGVRLKLEVLVLLLTTKSHTNRSHVLKSF